ncbi:MAG: CHAT domain-containing tetratricopeptide repeat protein [Hyphomicrobiaceae bacterium]
MTHHMLAFLLATAIGLASLAAPSAAQSPSFNDQLAKIDALIDAKRFDDAEPLARALVDQATRNSETDAVTKGLETADALHALAYARSGQGFAEEALKLLESVIEVRVRLIGADSLKVAQALNDQAVVLTTLGNYKEALPLHEKALEIREKAVPEGSIEVAQSLDNIVQVKRRLADTSGVEALLRRAIDLRGRLFGPGSAELGDSLADYADFLVDEGREKEALPLAAKALALTEQALGPEDEEVARRLIKLGNAQRAANAFAEAESSYRRAVAIRVKVFGRESRQSAGALSNLATAVALQGRAADAEPLLRQALDLQIRVRGKDHPSVGETLSRLANVVRDLGKSTEAASLYNQALAVQEGALGSNHPEVVETLAGAADLALRDGRLDDAFKLIGRASEISARLERVGRSIDVDDGETTKRQGEIDRRFVEIGFELAAAQSNRADELAVATFEAAQRTIHSRTGVALQELAARIAANDPALAELVRKRQDLAARWQAADKALVQALAKGSGDGAAAEMARLETGIASTDAAIAEKSADFAELTAPVPLSIADVQAILGPDEALVLLLSAPRGLLIWAVSHDQVAWVGSTLKSDELANRIATMRAAVDRPEANPAGLDLNASFELYRELLGASTIEAALAGKSHLVLIPSGALTGLPFQLLVTEAPADLSGPDRFRKASWLIREHALSVLPTISALKTLKSRPAAGDARLPYLGIADPVFKPLANDGDDTQDRSEPIGDATQYFKGRNPDLVALSRGLVELPETTVEASEIGRLLGADKSALVLRADASETTLKTMNAAGDLQRYRVVVFATHGLIAGEVEKLTRLRAEPALALTLPPEISPIDDGLLTASEAAELRLDADWVVLSACNTAAGAEPGAEALSGLTRSFLYAGARALLVSHWSVLSDAAVTLTTGTFAKLQADPGISRAEALRQTMLDILDRDANIKHSDPVYWAPFSLVGYGGT